ncbi:Protein CBG05325 [Caenorhabditis briggsae]|uniref:Protein CBG05325 n=1 Tax=Caenorhabditis briggsae TaxID=6238 RepID=A8WZL4_CAEBR|nr:Protein CBG05325 [Caenorhabditis briggsae]CAP25824.1 Protein CBG05325 [Caenorhabditis briggsae]
MSQFIFILCLLAGTFWGFVPNDPDFGGIIGYPHDDIHSLPSAFASFSDTPHQNPDEEIICEDKFNKCESYVRPYSNHTKILDELAGYLSTITPDIKVSVTLKSALPIGDRIKFNATAIGISSSTIDVEFVLNKPDQQLAYAQVHRCPIPRDS